MSKKLEIDLFTWKFPEGIPFDTITVEIEPSSFHKDEDLVTLKLFEDICPNGVTSNGTPIDDIEVRPI